MERLAMHRVREILRLRWVLRLGVRQAAAAAGVGRSVVSKTSNRAERAGQLNSRPIKPPGGKTRRELYASLDKPALRALPTERFECSEWLRPTATRHPHGATS